MVAERPDWCISRQRFWGVPLVVFYCDGCGKQLQDFKALRNVLPFFEREGADAWFTHSAEELLPAGNEVRRLRRYQVAQGNGHSRCLVRFRLVPIYQCSGEKDGTVACRHLPRRPGSFRGWFQSSLLIGGWHSQSRALPPGDDLRLGARRKGAPMSKSLGNAISPTEICEKWGADLLRIWVVSQDSAADMRMSVAMMTQLSEAYRKIRNTFRFALSNLFDFDPVARFGGRRRSLGNGRVDAPSHRRTREGSVASGMRRSNFTAFTTRLHDFCTVDLSSLYFDVLKDRLYTFAPNNRGRRSAQTAIYRIAEHPVAIDRAYHCLHR